MFAEDEEIRTMINTAIGKYLGVDEELDREVRHRLKHFREGTAEWEVEYAQLINQMRYSSKPQLIQSKQTPANLHQKVCGSSALSPKISNTPNIIRVLTA